MNAQNPDRLTPESLQRLLWEVEPAALLVPPRILRRVIKQHCGLGGLGLRVPHRKSYILPREDLFGIASADELGLRDDHSLPETVLLFACPDAPQLAAGTPGKVLLRYWQLLFHSTVHQAVRGLRAAGRLDAVALRDRIRRIGCVEFEEAGEVLRQENYLLAGASESAGSAHWPGGVAGTYEEFAAVYLELRYFDPHRREQFFPAVLDFAAIEAVLAEDVDAGELYRRTRPPGAFDPAHIRPPEQPGPEDDAALGDVPESESPGRLRLRAERASKRGNQVRAAVLRQRAVSGSPASQAGGLLAAARGEIEKLVHRLQRALQLPPAGCADWSRCLMALLPAASRGIWNREARLLYDLQKVCVDCERDLFAVDLVEWVVSWFHRPIKRRLPDQPLVLTVKHLRGAASRLPVVRMPDAERTRLGELLQSALHDTEGRLRKTLHPKLVAALDTVGLSPTSAAEGVSRDKMVEELLDRIVETGRLSIGDLRDALARNRLKLPDLSGPIQFFTGDPLIRINRQLAADLDGIYRRGEIYLRWLQRLTSLFFGTPLGRFLTLYLLLPVLGAFFILKGVNEVFELAHDYLGAPKIQTTDLHSYFGMDRGSFEFVSYAALAMFIFPMLHWPAFRRGVLTGLHLLWLGLRGLLFDLPATILRWPAVRLVLQSKIYLVFFQFVGKPLAWTLPLSGLLWLAGLSLPWIAGISAGSLALFSVLINSKMGLIAEETAADWLVRTWELIGNDLLPGIFRSIIYVFNRFKERVDQIIYTVDEWLRFRTGEGLLSFTCKMMLGLMWFYITYIVRFAINLLIEPQINPIKHFPVVTVSHKFLLPLAATSPRTITTTPSPLASLLLGVVPMSIERANIVTATVVWGIPGIFGFLAWELKENWRLYRANAPATLEPEMVGSHGERVINLIRPGFHAGTLPKLYAHLRQASGSAERKNEKGLHHVDESVRHFIQRDLIATLTATQAWGNGCPLTAGRIRLGTNRIHVELCCPALGSIPVGIDLANRAGWLVAGIDQAGWLHALTPGQRNAFRDALAGFWKLAGVDVVYEQIRAAFPSASDFEFTDRELFVWFDADHSHGVVYNLILPEHAPRLIGNAAEEVPADARRLLFARDAITWNEWVKQWELERAGKEPDAPLLPATRLLPMSA